MDLFALIFQKAAEGTLVNSIMGIFLGGLIYFLGIPAFIFLLFYLAFRNFPTRLSWWYILPPIITIVWISPPILDSPPWVNRQVLNPNIFQTLILMPFYLGLAAAPGYLYAWVGHRDPKILRSATRMWVAISLWTAALSSLIGGLLSILTVIVAPFAFWSFVMSVILLGEFFKEMPGLSMTYRKFFARIASSNS